MKIKSNKLQYLSPEADIFEVKTESVICVSGGDYPGWSEEGI